MKFSLVECQQWCFCEDTGDETQQLKGESLEPCKQHWVLLEVFTKL